MKIRIKYLCIFTICLLINTDLKSQTYSFFNASSKKLFAKPDYSGKLFSLDFDSTKTSSSETTFYPFYALSNSLIPGDSCHFWGTNDCVVQNQPVWLGIKILLTVGKKYCFFNNSMDSINIPTDFILNDTNLMYRDVHQDFYLVNEKIDTIHILGNIDSAKYFRILHKDANGNSINSAMNQQYVVVGKQYGLIKFFSVDSFPTILQPLILVGNNSPLAGLTAITNELLYDYQPGDELQYREYSNCNNCPPWYKYTRYRKHTILSRQIASDTLIYQVEEHLFDGDTIDTQKTMTWKLYRYGILFSIPFERFDGANRSLEYNNYCGEKFTTYNVYNPNNGIYCNYSNCWGGKEIFGNAYDAYRYSSTYVLGLGRYFYNRDPIILGPNSTLIYLTNEIIYFKKNGKSCGIEQPLSVSELDNVSLFNIFPNPNKGSMQIDYTLPESEPGQFEIFDLAGKKMLSYPLKGGKNNLTISNTDLGNGIYLYQLLSNDRIIAKDKLVIIK